MSIIKGTYRGLDRRLEGLEALLRFDKDDDSCWLAQFDCHYEVPDLRGFQLGNKMPKPIRLREAYGWTKFPRTHFNNVNATVWLRGEDEPRMILFAGRTEEQISDFFSAELREKENA